MNRTVGIIFAGAALCLVLNVFFTLPVRAQTAPDYNNTPTAPNHAKKKTVKHRRTSHRKTHARKSSTSITRAHIRTAQIYLDQLGYKPGPSDGIIGPKTRTAIKGFQRDHHLKASGTLSDATFRALAKEAGSQNPERSSAAPPADFLAAHPDFYGYYGPDYANPTMLGSPQAIPSRFGTIGISEQSAGSTSGYVVTLNDQAIFHADDQPAPVNVSRTFNLDGADAILLTSYVKNDSVCPYRHNLLVVRTTGSGVHPISNCTRDYQAYTENGMLLISFPGDHANGWSSGDAWRYDNGNLEKL